MQAVVQIVLIGKDLGGDTVVAGDGLLDTDEKVLEDLGEDAVED